MKSKIKQDKQQDPITCTFFPFPSFHSNQREQIITKINTDDTINQIKNREQQNDYHGVAEKDNLCESLTSGIEEACECERVSLTQARGGREREREWVRRCLVFQSFDGHIHLRTRALSSLDFVRPCFYVQATGFLSDFLNGFLGPDAEFTRSKLVIYLYFFLVFILAHNIFQKNNIIIYNKYYYFQ